MSKGLSAKQRSALQRVIDDPELQPWLFKKVSDPVWFDAFMEHGLFSPEFNPKPLETKKNVFQVQSWSITNYLVASSLKIKEDNDLKAAGKYLSLIRDVTQYAIDADFGNHRTWWQFSKVLRNLPINIISLDDMKYIGFWLTDKFDKHLVAKEISEWVSELVDEKDEHSIYITLSLLDVLFTITSIDSRYSGDRKEAVLHFDNYQANEFVNKSAKRFGEQLGLPAIVLFERKLIEVLDANGNDKWSNLWRKAMEEHEQNRGNDADDIILNLFRDSMLGYYQTNRTIDSEAKLVSLLNSGYETIKRIAIYIASQCFEHLEESTIEQVISKTHFNDKFRHELWHFLNKNFAQLTETNQTSVIEDISSLEVKNEADVIEPKPTAYKQSNWYAAIVEADERARRHYQQCVEIIGIEPENTDFSCYSSAGFTVNESPLSVTELAVMLDNPAELVQFLNGYDYIGHFGEAGIEGLVENFGALVSLDDCIFLNNLEQFSDLKPHYLNEIFSSYLNLWTMKIQRDWDSLWPKLINFAHELFKLDTFWQTADNKESGPFIGDVHWVVSAYSRLIESGCEKNEYAFDLRLCEKVKGTLELILERESGSDFDKDSSAVSIAINSPRGRCLEAYFKLALYQCRNVDKDSEDHVNIWTSYEPVFSHELNKPTTSNEYEFITLVVMYIRNFLFLSKNWTHANLGKMFGDTGSQQWLCSIQAYSYVGWLIPEVHAIFKDKGYYLDLLDRPNLNDSVKDRYVEYICIAYLQGIEKFDDNDSLLTNLLTRGRDKELGKLIWFLWSIKDQDIKTTKGLVFLLWPKLVELISVQTNKQNPLASKLGLWAEYIDHLDVESKSWLLEIAPFINDDHNGVSFMEELARLSITDALCVADIWKATLINPFYAYDLKPLEKIFKNLIALGKDGQAIAKEIVGVYIRNSDEAVVRLYKSLI